MLDLDELKEMHDNAYNQNTLTRERGADDLVFYWITQWDDNLLDQNTLSYRGEFNILRKAGRQIMSDLRSNPVQIDFEPKSTSREDGADLIDGLYLTDDRVNTSIESYNTASTESVVCGVGAWELFSEYESSRSGEEHQVIRRNPVNEANNNCFWDPNAKLLDKSDASFVSILEAFTFQGYQDLVKKLTGEEDLMISMDSFSNPSESYVFPWASGKNEAVYVVRFYHIDEVKDKVLSMTDPMGNPLMLRQSDVEDIRDELEESGYTIDSEKEIVRKEIIRYIASGERILATDVIAGENIPVVPVYGERAFVEGEEHWEGVTRLAKDPQRLRNFQMSYLADIVSRSPREKPVMLPEQVQGFEFMYEENGADNNFPYVLQNRTTAQGEPLPLGPVGMLPPANMSNSMAACIELTRQAVEDVANPGLPKDISDPSISGKAVMAMQARLDNQSQIYQENLKHAKRRDAVIYASMAADIYDAPRTVTLTSQDGSRKRQKIMEVVQDRQSGEMITLNDITNMEFDVYAEIGRSYTSKKEETLDEINKDLMMLEPGNPMREILLNKKYELMDGANFEDIRKYARNRLLLMGVREPETEEEAAMLQQQQQQQQEPDANTLLAMAEMKKGDAAIMREQRQAILDQEKMKTEQGSLQVDVFKAQTDRANMQVNAQKVGAEINYKRIQAVGEDIDNRLKVSDSFRARLAPSTQARQ